MSFPLVSVVMPVFNGLQYLPSAIKSILAQTYQNFEIIIIDDGSTDGASEYLDSVSPSDQHIRVLHQENKGLSYSLNRGIFLSKGKYIARMDGDDIADSNRLALQVEYMESRPDVAMCSTGAVFFDGHENFAYSIHQMPDDHETLVLMMEKGENPFIHGSIMIKAEAYLSMKEGYRLNSSSQDLDLWLRMSCLFKFGVVQKVLYGYRVSYESTGIGSLSRKCKITDIIFQLHKERKMWGKELSDWKKLTSNEAGYAKKNIANKTKCDDVAKYVRALHWLSVRKYMIFFNLMREVANGESVYSRKAKVLILFYPISAPFWWLFYYVKKQKTISGKWVKILKSDTEIPEFLLQEFIK